MPIGVVHLAPYIVRAKFRFTSDVPLESEIFFGNSRWKQYFLEHGKRVKSCEEDMPDWHGFGAKSFPSQFSFGGVLFRVARTRITMFSWSGFRLVRSVHASFKTAWLDKSTPRDPRSPLEPSAFERGTKMQMFCEYINYGF